MKTTTVRALTDAANAIATALDDDATTDVTTPLVITLSYLDASGRARTARHTVGVPGWNVDASAAPSFTPPF